MKQDERILLMRQSANAAMMIKGLFAFDSLGDETASEMYAARARDVKRASGNATAALGLYGMLSQRGYYGGTSTDLFGLQLDRAIADTSIRRVIIDVDSPGGTAAGIPELAEKLRRASKQKEIIAVANSQAASAALWIASQATKFYVTPSGEVGSIGVWTAHVDQSKMLEREGLDVSLISAGRYKTEGNPFEPLGKDARAEMQRSVNVIHTEFIKAVARGRGVSSAAVRQNYGDGRMLEAKRAKAVGLVDGVKTLEAVLSQPMGKPTKAEMAAVIAQNKAKRERYQREQLGIAQPFESPTAREELLRALNGDWGNDDAEFELFN